MQNEIMRGGQPAMGSENVGDVLASIRRLIAQDGGAGRLTTAPDLAAAFRHADLLNARVADSATPDLRQVAAPMPEARVTPLTLERDNLVAPEAPAQPVLRLHLTPSFADLPEPEPIAAPQPTERAGMNMPAFATPVFSQRPALLWPAPATLMGQPAAPVDAPAPAMPQVSPSPPAAPLEPATAGLSASVAPPPPEHPVIEDMDDLHLFAPEDADLAHDSVLRSLIRDAIRQELQGEMGGRFSRNLRQVIRHEVDLALRQARRARPGT